MGWYCIGGYDGIDHLWWDQAYRQGCRRYCSFHGIALYHGRLVHRDNQLADVA